MLSWQQMTQESGSTFFITVGSRMKSFGPSCTSCGDISGPPRTTSSATPSRVRGRIPSCMVTCGHRDGARLWRRCILIFLVGEKIHAASSISPGTILYITGSSSITSNNKNAMVNTPFPEFRNRVDYLIATQTNIIITMISNRCSYVVCTFPRLLRMPC